MKRNSPRTIGLSAALLLVVTGCVGPVSPAPVWRQGPAGDTTRARALVRLATGSQAPFKQAFALKGVSFSDPSITYLRFTAAGSDFAPVSQDYPWTPGQPMPAIGVAVPVGKNRVFTLTAMDYRKLPQVSLKGVATVAATGTNAVTINWGTTATAAVLEDLILNNPTVAAQVDLADLQALVDTITGYDAATGTYTSSPTGVVPEAIAAGVVTNAGAVPASDPAFFSLDVGKLRVVVQDAEGNPITSGVRLQVSDLTSIPIAATVAAETEVGGVSFGRWLVTATHATFGEGTVEAKVGAGSATSPGVVTVSLGVPAARSIGQAGTVRTLVSNLHEPVDGSLGSGVFRMPTGVAIAGGKAYVGDHHALREVDLASGAMKLVAGDFDTWSDVDGIGLQARFKKISTIVADQAGRTLYIADRDAHRIRKVDLATMAVTTVAGSGAEGHVNARGTSAAFSYPHGLALAPDESFMLVTDTVNRRIRKVSLELATYGTVSDFAGSGEYWSEPLDGSAASASFPEPCGIIIDREGRFAYVLDESKGIRKVVVSPAAGTPGTVTTLTGGTGAYQEGGPGEATFDWNDYSAREFRGSGLGLALSDDGATLYVSDTRNHRIRQVDLATGMTATFVGSGEASYEDGTGTAARLLAPAGLANGGDGQLYFVDAWNFRLRKADLTTRRTALVAGAGKTGFAEGIGGTGSAAQMVGLAFDKENNQLFLRDRLANRIWRYDPAADSFTVFAGSGRSGYQDGPAADAKFDLRRYDGMLVDNKRNQLYVCEERGIRALPLSGARTVTTMIAANWPKYRGLTLDATGDVLYAAASDGTIHTLDLTADPVVDTGTIAGTFTGHELRGLTRVGTTLFAAEGEGGKIWKLDLGAASPVATRWVGTGTKGHLDGNAAVAQLGWMQSLNPDASGKYLYLGEFWWEDWAIRRVRLEDGGVESIMRGRWDEQDGEIDLAATSGGIFDAAFDASGTNLYFLDRATHSLRKVGLR